MGNDYKTFLGVPGSFFLHGWQCFFCSWAVPGGLWGHESGHVYNTPNIIFKPYRALTLYPRTEPHCRLPCQTSAKNSFEFHCHMCNHGPDTINVALYVSPCCADIERNRSKKGGFFLQETMPCIHGPSLCVCVYACTRGSCVDSI